jgi:hypothetical protein
VTIAGHVYTPSLTTYDSTTEIVLAPGTTLKPGSATTIDGTLVSIDQSATALVIGSSTSMTVSTAPSATTTGIGGFIASGIGVVPFEGEAGMLNVIGGVTFVVFLFHVFLLVYL